jgi:hypothetical protein
VACSDNNKVIDDEGPIPDNWITLATDPLNVAYNGDTKELDVAFDKNVDFDKVAYTLTGNGSDWCTATLTPDKLMIRVERSYSEWSRSTDLRISYDKEHQTTLTIRQEASPSPEDSLIKVIAGEATSEETSSKDTDGNPLTLAMSYDGNKKTYFNSKFGAISQWPFNITYTLEAGHTLNRIVYTPRTDSGNKWGSFDEFTVWVSTADKPDEFTEVGSYARGNGVHTPFDIAIPGGVANVAKVRFVINKSYESRVSCAEMEFYQASDNAFNPYSIFADELCTKLKEGVTELQIKQIPNLYLRNLGLALLAGNYDLQFRLATYRPYQHPQVMATANKTNKLSLRDNPTGIYVSAGETLPVFVGTLKYGNISMMIQDVSGGYGNSKTYELHAGYNEVKADIDGLIYILNHVDDDLPIQPVTEQQRQIIKDKSVEVHFAMGKVNGYFDIAKNTEADWTKILGNAKFRVIDVLGNLSHLTWTVADFQQYRTKITETVHNLDSLVYLEEEFIGLVKYKRMFNNRLHFSVDFTAKSPNSSDYRTVYSVGESNSYAEIFCNPSRFTARLWGPAHEVGHSLNTRPGMTWAGVTEVTNNIMALYVQTSFGQGCKLFTDKITPKDEQGNAIAGDFKNIYEASIAFIVDGKRAHCLPDVKDIVRETQLVPFWQLKLYLVDALGQTDFYHDLMEYFRTHDSPSQSGENQGMNQLDFVRQVCTLSKRNLLDFFEDWGFLTPVNTTLNDYGDKKFIITTEQIEALKKEITAKNYPKAPDNLYRIDDSNFMNFKP